MNVNEVKNLLKFREKKDYPKFYMPIHKCHKMNFETPMKNNYFKKI